MCKSCFPQRARRGHSQERKPGPLTPGKTRPTSLTTKGAQINTHQTAEHGDLPDAQRPPCPLGGMRCSPQGGRAEAPSSMNVSARFLLTPGAQEPAEGTPHPHTQSGIHLCRLRGGHGAAGHPPRGTGSWPGTDMGTGERPQRCPGSGERRMGAVLPRHPREIPHPSTPPQGTSVLREHITGNPPPSGSHRGTRASVSRTTTGHAGWDGAAGVRRGNFYSNWASLTPEQAQVSLGPEGLWLSG